MSSLLSQHSVLEFLLTQTARQFIYNFFIYVYVCFPTTFELNLYVFFYRLRNKMKLGLF